MKCDYCGCSEFNACLTAVGPCAWVSKKPPVCSAPSCEKRWKRQQQKERVILGRALLAAFSLSEVFRGERIVVVRQRNGSVVAANACDIERTDALLCYLVAPPKGKPRQKGKTQPTVSRAEARRRRQPTRGT